MLFINDIRFKTMLKAPASADPDLMTFCFAFIQGVEKFLFFMF